MGGGNFWQRTRTLKFPDLEVGSVFKDYDFQLVCSVDDNLEDMDALSFNYWLAKFIQEVERRAAGILHECCMVSYAV